MSPNPFTGDQRSDLGAIKATGLTIVDICNARLLTQLGRLEQTAKATIVMIEHLLFNEHRQTLFKGQVKLQTVFTRSTVKTAYNSHKGGTPGSSAASIPLGSGFFMYKGFRP